MPAEAPAPPAPELNNFPDSAAPELTSFDLPTKEGADFTIWEAEVSGEAVVLDATNTNLVDLLLNTEPITQDGDLGFSRMMPETQELLADKLPPGVWQNGAVMHVIQYVNGIKPQLMGTILKSGTTWWFMSTEDALTVDPDYVGGFAQSFMLEKLWQDTL